MSKKHHLIFVPGLGGENKWFKKSVSTWEKYGFIPHTHDIGWKDPNGSFPQKLQRFIDFIDTFDSHDTISLIGISAGGSAVLNAFCEKKDRIHRVINICGRLRAGVNVMPSLDFAARKSPAFKESVLLFEKNEPSLTTQERKKVLTVRALYDEVVPTSTIPLEDAQNKRIFSIEHMISIAVALTMYRQSIIDFLKEK